MLPTLPVLSMLPSVRLRLSQRLKLMLLFSMADMAVMVLDMAVDLDMLVLDTMARGLLMLSLRPRLMLLFSMEDMAMVDMDVDMPDLDMPDMEVMVLDMAVVSTMVNSYLPSFLKQKLKVISDWHVVIQCPLFEV